MAAIEIRIDPTAPNDDFSATLQGRFYYFRKVYNQREDDWYLSILDENKDPIVSGCKVFVDCPLFKRSQDARLPPGVVMAIDTSGKRLNPGLNDFGVRVRLYYFELDA